MFLNVAVAHWDAIHYIIGVFYTMPDIKGLDLIAPTEIFVVTHTGPTQEQGNYSKVIIQFI